MQDANPDRVAQLLADLKETQAVLSAAQQELLEAIAGDAPGQQRLRQEVWALGLRALRIIGQVEQELRRLWAGAGAARPQPRRELETT